MLEYGDLYEHLRKEKYSEKLQPLPKNFVLDFSGYLKSKRKEISSFEGELFSDDVMKGKKQFENAISIFKELILRRKKKILNLVFIAAETGIMKRDFTDMLSFEQVLFEKLVKAVNEGDKSLEALMNGKSAQDKDENKMIIILEDIENFVDMVGKVVGPFKKGTLVNLDTKVADILVSEKKARLVDANQTE